MNNKQKILDLLSKNIPYAGSTLHFSSPFELLIAVMLSAQCTDKQVNKITARLFSKYKIPIDFVFLDQVRLAEAIKGCGLHRKKSQYIKKTACMLVEKYAGHVPDNLKELQLLPGVGRKTANVILNLAYNKPTFPVDTHIHRVSCRLGLSDGKTPYRVERDLIDLIPAKERGIWHHRLIAFGRSTCVARKPRCINCVVGQYCPSVIKQNT